MTPTSPLNQTVSSAIPAPAHCQADILAAFQGTLPPVRVPLRYRLGILLVAVVMLILPLIYIGITLLVAYVVYAHAVNDTFLLGLGSGRGQLLAVLIYLAPIIIGGILVLFMFKPLFSQPPRPPQREPVDPAKEPLLFAFVERVCAAVGAPRPKRIALDCEVNASASFRRGLLSMVGNDLVLTIGLPLVAELSLREFAGVLAHEFGHFAQGAGMRLTYIIRSISHWFTRVVYERDAWDERLVHWSQSLDIRLSWVIYLARFFVWLTRRILWVLMILGHAVSGFMLRQMEFDADRYEARLAGSDAFASTMRKIVTLSIAAQGARSDLSEFYREGRLGDNLPKLIQHNVNQFAPEAHAQISALMTRSATNLFATHPNEAARIARAQREQAPGIFHSEQPAALLFTNFDQSCKAVTEVFYTDLFRHTRWRANLHDVDELLSRQEQERAVFNALVRYWQGIYQSNRPLRLPAWQLDDTSALVEASCDEADVRQQLVAARTELLRIAPPFRQWQARGTGRSRGLHNLVEQQLVTQEELIGRRLLLGLQLLYVPAIAKQTPQSAEWRMESGVLLPVLKLLDEQLDAMGALHSGTLRLAQLLQMLSQDQGNEQLVAVVFQQRDETLARIKTLRNQLDTAAYPFAHAKGVVKLGVFVLEQIPLRDNLGDILKAAQMMIESMMRLRARIVGTLCLMAEAMEQALGLVPLPDVPTDEAQAPNADPSETEKAADSK